MNLILWPNSASAFASAIVRSGLFTIGTKRRIEGMNMSTLQRNSERGRVRKNI